jgi:phage tail tube protein FII
MKDKEMIEEMAKDLKEEKLYALINKTSYMRSAENLYEQGYRKIDKDSVVLSREEICELKCQAEEDFNKAYDLGSKKTAEKIWLQAKTIVDKTKHLVQGREYLHIDALKEIAKSCGVEIKE